MSCRLRSLNLLGDAVPLGIEQVFVGCARTTSNAETVEFSGLPVREVLNQLVAQVPLYAWRDMDGVVVVRPQLEWNDPAEFMNMDQQVPAFKASAEHLGPAYKALSFHFCLAFPDNNHWLVNNKRELPDFQIDFGGGSLLEALNAFVRARAEFSWAVGSCSATTTTFDNASVSIAATRMDMMGRPWAVTIPVVDPKHPRPVRSTVTWRNVPG